MNGVKDFFCPSSFGGRKGYRGNALFEGRLLLETIQRRENEELRSELHHRMKHVFGTRRLHQS